MGALSSMTCEQTFASGHRFGVLCDFPKRKKLSHLSDSERCDEFLPFLKEATPRPTNLVFSCRQSGSSTRPGLAPEISDGSLQAKAQQLPQAFDTSFACFFFGNRGICGVCRCPELGGLRRQARTGVRPTLGPLECFSCRPVGGALGLTMVALSKHDLKSSSSPLSPVALRGLAAGSWWYLGKLLSAMRVLFLLKIIDFGTQAGSGLGAGDWWCAGGPPRSKNRHPNFNKSGSRKVKKSRCRFLHDRPDAPKPIVQEKKTVFSPSFFFY